MRDASPNDGLVLGIESSCDETAAAVVRTKFDCTAPVTNTVSAPAATAAPM